MKKEEEEDLKLSYFCKKRKIFERWGLRSQTPVLRRLGASPIDPQWPLAVGGSASRPQNGVLHYKFLATRLDVHTSLFQRMKVRIYLQPRSESALEN